MSFLYTIARHLLSQQAALVKFLLQLCELLQWKGINIKYKLKYFPYIFKYRISASCGFNVNYVSKVWRKIVLKIGCTALYLSDHSCSEVSSFFLAKEVMFWMFFSMIYVLFYLCVGCLYIYALFLLLNYDFEPCISATGNFYGIKTSFG